MDGHSQARLHATRELMLLRRSRPSLRHGDFALDPAPPGTIAIRRTVAGQTTVCAVNPTAAAVEVPLPWPDNPPVVLAASSPTASLASRPPNAVVTLPPRSAVLVGTAQ